MKANGQDRPKASCDTRDPKSLNKGGLAGRVLFFRADTEKGPVSGPALDQVIAQPLIGLLDAGDLPIAIAIAAHADPVIIICPVRHVDFRIAPAAFTIIVIIGLANNH